jgi:hypothetical protein
VEDEFKIVLNTFYAAAFDYHQASAAYIIYEKIYLKFAFMKYLEK